MRTEKLEIIRYSTAGKVLRRIACLPGFISVFRSRSEVELGFYIDALHLRSAAGVSEIKINKEPATPEQLVYFDAEQSLSSSDVSAWLIDIISLGDGYGKLVLKRLSDEIKLPVSADHPSFSQQDLKILKLLALLSQNTRVVVLDDPFVDIAEEVLEPLAKAMVELIEKSDTIVVVKKLSVRPEAWIENEHVERVQIEAPRQRTIGFGGHRFEIETPSIPVSSPHHVQLGMSSAMHPALDRSSLPGFKAKRHVLSITLCASLLAAVLVVALIRSTDLKPQTTTHSSSNSSSSNPFVTGSDPISQHAADETNSKSSKESNQLALASYPADIQVAVARAFSAPEEEIKLIPAFPSAAPKQVKQVANNSLQQESSAPSSASESESASPPSESDEELAERRARVRQSFLEALARARERLAAERNGQY